MAMTDRKLIALFIRFAARHKRGFFKSLAIMPVYAGILSTAPKVVQHGIDNGILKHDTAVTLGCAGVYLLCVLCALGALVLQNLWMQQAGISTLADIRAAVMDRASRLGTDRFDRQPLGVYVARATSDIEAIGETMAAGLTNIIADSLLIAFIFANMLIADVRLGLWSLLLFPVIVVVVDVFRRVLRRLYDHIRTLNGKLTARINETLTMGPEVHSFALHETFASEYLEDNTAYRDANIKVISYDALLYSIMDGLSFIAVGGAILVISGAGVGEAVQIGAVVAYIQWLGLLFPPIRQMGSRFAVLQSALAAIRKVQDILEQPLPADDGADAPADATVELEALSFAYQSDEPVLKKIDLTVPSGSSLAVVGPTGAGKSTLVRLITRLYDLPPEHGVIRVGGVPIHEIPRERLKQMIVLVPQEPSIFPESVRYNIGLGRPDLADADIEQICRDITADAFIQALPHGYDTPLASGGSNLSMGQRQLIALARALASGADLLVFDEATANIDTETERLIQQALDSVMAHRTTILIAHRLSTIRHVDNIVVMHHGRIADSGSHDELMNRTGLYRTMVELHSPSDHSV
jgi:ATP-binding cassette subfamily B protein